MQELLMHLLEGLIVDQEARKRLIEVLEMAQAGRSQREFARDLGVQLGTLQHWLKGDSVPVIDKFERIAASLGKSPEAIIGYVLRGEESEGNLPAAPKVAEDVVNYASSLSVEEKVRLVGLTAEVIAIEARREGKR